MRSNFRTWNPFRPTRKPRRRLLWVTSEYNPRVGGLEKLVEQLLAALSAFANVGLITNVGQYPKPGEMVSHVGALNLKGCRTEAEFQSVCVELHRLCVNFRPDVIHLASGGLACFAELLSEIAPVFCTVHCKDITAPWQRIPDKDVGAAISAGLERCVRVFCVSDYARRHLSRLAPCAVAETLMPGLPVASLGTAPGRFSHFTPPEGTPRILTVARLAPRKGHAFLLEALRTIKRPFIWDIVGTGPVWGEFEARVEASAIADNVIMHGTLTEEQLALLFQQCDLFALTPVEIMDNNGIDAEGFGLAYLEAASYCKPSIGSILGGCAEAISDGRTGFAVDPRDTCRLASSIERLLGSLPLRQSMGLAAFERLKSDFRIEDRAAVLMQHYSVH